MWCSEGLGQRQRGAVEVARIDSGPDERRGITELNGEGEVASGTCVAALSARTHST